MLKNQENIPDHPTILRQQKQTNSDKDKSVMVTSGEGGWGQTEKVKRAKCRVREGNYTLGGEHTAQYTDGVL